MTKIILVALLAIRLGEAPAAPQAAADFPVWMSGSWRSSSDGNSVEEHWTSADGGIMVGMGRTISRSGKTAFEFIRIESRDGALAYIAMPGGRPATIFPMKSLEKERIVFENLQHDFPQRVIYWRDGARLCARVEGTVEGKLEGEEFCWNRVE